MDPYIPEWGHVIIRYCNYQQICGVFPSVRLNIWQNSNRRTGLCSWIDHNVLGMAIMQSFKFSAATYIAFWQLPLLWWCKPAVWPSHTTLGLALLIKFKKFKKFKCKSWSLGIEIGWKPTQSTISSLRRDHHSIRNPRWLRPQTFQNQ